MILTSYLTSGLKRIPYMALLCYHNNFATYVCMCYAVIVEQEAAHSDPLTTGELAVISQSISDWPALARDLNLSDDEIHAVFQQETGRPSEQCLHMLNYWVECLERNSIAQQSRTLLTSALRKQGYSGLADFLATGYVHIQQKALIHCMVPVQKLELLLCRTSTLVLVCSY